MTAEDKLAVEITRCPKCGAERKQSCKDGGTCHERRSERKILISGRLMHDASMLLPHDEEYTLP